MTTFSNEQNLFRSTSSYNWKTHLQVHYVFHLVFFVVGLSIGLTASLYFKSIPLYVQATLSSISSPTLSSMQSSHLSSSSSPRDPPPSSFISTRPPSSSIDDYQSVSEKFLSRNVSDEELLLEASRVPVQVSIERAPKVAFMFIAKGALPLAPLWEKFFEGHEGLYSIYVHSKPSYKDSWPVNSVFYGRRIASQPIIWGTGTMVDAERRLLAHALLDPSNQRFVLLSESCIPLFDFKTVYDYLINADSSMVETYDIPGRDSRGRYNPNMSPLINITNWRKGSQWFEARRDLAYHIVTDNKYYRVFQEYCLPPCFMDEHYIPTLANMVYPDLVSNRSVTFVDWSKSGPHPRKFGLRDNITEEFLHRVRYGKKCVYNGSTTSKCFLFARKFSPNALVPLLRVLFGSGPN